MSKIIKKEIIEEVNAKMEKTDKKPWYKRWYILLTMFIFVVMMIFNYNYTFVLVNGSSMHPNFEDGNFVLAERQYDRLNRFDVVVIYSDKAEHILIKRVIGLPGDKVECINNELFVNDEFIEDVYCFGITNDFNVTVEEDSYYCLGDNRENSLDSRVYGTFTEDEIIAKVKSRRHVEINNNPFY